MSESALHKEAPNTGQKDTNGMMQALRLTLQRKYTLTFSLIFLGVIIYLIYSLLNEEEKDFIDYTNENFKTIFLTINAMGEEAMSAGTRDRLALKTVVKSIFESEIKGLEKIFFVRYNPQKDEYRYFVYHDKAGQDLTDSLVTPEVMATIKARAAKFQVIENGKVYLTQKVVYKTPIKDVFLGYSQLVFSYDHISMVIAKRRQDHLTIGVLCFLLSLVIISVVTALLIRRIKLLNEATKGVSQGKLNTVSVKGSDEVAELTQSYNEMILGLRERLLMSRYVSQATIGLIREKRLEDVDLGGSRESVCIFFSDIRGFTKFSEQHDAQQVVSYLNHLLNVQVQLIREHGGDIDKFVGDEVMAVFRGEHKEVRAIEAAIAVQRSISRLVAEDPLFSELKVGVGINTGEVVAGNIGSRDRMDYTVIGDVVNTASRLCSAAGAGEILITEDVKNKLPKQVVTLSEPFNLPLKNKSNTLNLYKVVYDQVGQSAPLHQDGVVA
jgi:class 3 adenylate cyclase